MLDKVRMRLVSLVTVLAVFASTVLPTSVITNAYGMKITAELSLFQLELNAEEIVPETTVRTCKGLAKLEHFNSFPITSGMYPSSMYTLGLPNARYNIAPMSGEKPEKFLIYGLRFDVEGMRSPDASTSSEKGSATLSASLLPLIGPGTRWSGQIKLLKFATKECERLGHLPLTPDQLERLKGIKLGLYSEVPEELNRELGRLNALSAEVDGRTTPQPKLDSATRLKHVQNVISRTSKAGRVIKLSKHALPAINLWLLKKDIEQIQQRTEAAQRVLEQQEPGRINGNCRAALIDLIGRLAGRDLLELDEGRALLRVPSVAAELQRDEWTPLLEAIAERGIFDDDKIDVLRTLDALDRLASEGRSEEAFVEHVYHLGVNYWTRVGNHDADRARESFGWVTDYSTDYPRVRTVALTNLKKIAWAKDVSTGEKLEYGANEVLNVAFGL